MSCLFAFLKGSGCRGEGRNNLQLKSKRFDFLFFHPELDLFFKSNRACFIASFPRILPNCFFIWTHGFLEAYSEPSPLLFDRRPAQPSTKEAERMACKRPNGLDHMQEGT